MTRVQTVVAKGRNVLRWFIHFLWGRGEGGESCSELSFRAGTASRRFRRPGSGKTRPRKNHCKPIRKTHLHVAGGAAIDGREKKRPKIGSRALA